MNLPKAAHSGEVTIGNVTLPCFVLEDGSSMLSQRAVLEALGKSGSMKGRKNLGDQLPPFLAQKNIKPFINKDLTLATIPIKFRIDTGPIAYGYKAEILPLICETYLKARDAGVLRKSQEHIARQAESLLRGFAHVGIIALIHEATGYDKVKNRAELNKVLTRYLRPFEARWAKRFPDEFYEEIYRLKGWGWEWEGMQTNRNQIVGHFTNDIVYARMEDYLLDHLRQINPKDEEGERKNKHHQWLTDDFGVQELREHLVAVMAIMGTVRDNNPKRAWPEFMRRLQRSRPKKNTNYDLDFDE